MANAIFTPDGTRFVEVGCGIPPFLKVKSHSLTEITERLMHVVVMIRVKCVWIVMGLIERKSLLLSAV
jgi:hypothetical protein